MKQFILFILLISSLSAQVRIPGPGGSGTTAAVNAIGPVDAYIDGAGFVVGTTVTTATLGTSTIGNANMSAGWSLSVSPITGEAGAATHCGLLGSVQVNGTTYTTAHASQAISYDHTQTLRNVRNGMGATSNNVYNVFSMGGCLVTGPPSVAQGSAVLFDDIYIADDGGHYAALQLNNGNCGGSAVYGINLETNPSGVTTHSTCITLTPTSTYWYSVFVDWITPTAKFAIFDSTGTQVGTTITATMATGAGFSELRIGNNETGTATATSYFENTFIRFSGGAPFPLGPKNTTQDPVYWVAQSHNNKTSAGTTVATTKALDVPANSCQVVTCSNENGSGQTTGVTNTAGDTFTAAAAVKSAANAQSISQWVSCGNAAHTGQTYTCTFPSSSFSNIDVQLLGGATAYDTGAVGNVASGANSTTASFTPSTSTGTNVACAYIQAGFPMTAGTNYQLLNASGTNSMSCELRTNAPNSSQTASMTHANTSASMIVVGNYKQ